MKITSFEKPSTVQRTLFANKGRKALFVPKILCIRFHNGNILLVLLTTLIRINDCQNLGLFLSKASTTMGNDGIEIDTISCI